MIQNGESLKWILETQETAEELAEDHKMDISGSVYTRMKELGMTQADLARDLGADQSWISRIITGKENLTIGTIARLELALDFRLDAGFRYTCSHALHTDDMRSWVKREDKKSITNEQKMPPILPLCIAA